MALSPKHAVVAVTAAAVLGALLIGAPGSFAKFNSTKTGATLAITSGTITASVSSPTTGTVSTGTAPSGVVVNTPTTGMVPGIQDETFTYTVTNASSSASPAAITAVEVKSASITNSTAWSDIRPYLGVTVKVGTATAVAVPSAGITSAGIDSVVTTTGNVKAGSTLTVVITFDLPATGSPGSVDLTRTLQGDQNVANILQLAPIFTLTQIPRAAAP